jgi:ribulose-5-phosphate 4-epimerase/fuculose-1-phosphate aldolase
MLKKFMIRGVLILTLITYFMISGDLVCSYAADESTVRQLKEKLIIANKILELEKLATPYGHVSVRIPGTESFLITRSVAPGMATLDDIVVCDLNGKVLEGKYKSTYSEVVIHTGVYKKRKDVHSVVHTHSSYVIALSMTDNTVLPVNLMALGIGPQPIALFSKMVYIDKQGLGEEICDLLGPNKAVILKGHGAVIVGANIEGAVSIARSLEYNAMLQWMARCVGNLAPMTEEEKQMAIQFQQKVEKRGSGYQRGWAYYESILKK